MEHATGIGRSHVFDAVLDPAATNADLFNTQLKAVVPWVLNGHNATVIAYGSPFTLPTLSASLPVYMSPSFGLPLSNVPLSLLSLLFSSVPSFSPSVIIILVCFQLIQI